MYNSNFEIGVRSMKKRTVAILRTAVAALAALALLLAALPASAVSTASTAFGKGSRSEYVENSYLNVREEVLWSFDEGDDDGNYAVDTSDFTQGNACGKITSKWVDSSKRLFTVSTESDLRKRASRVLLSVPFLLCQ